jgi:hypothetical protein
MFMWYYGNVGSKLRTVFSVFSKSNSVYRSCKFVRNPETHTHTQSYFRNKQYLLFSNYATIHMLTRKPCTRVTDKLRNAANVDISRVVSAIAKLFGLCPQITINTGIPLFSQLMLILASRTRSKSNVERCIL